jgi:hypothetical protein
MNVEMIHSVFERDGSVETMSFIFCKNKDRRVESYMGCFFFFSFFLFLSVYRNLSRLGDQICMVMAWKNYYVKGSKLYLCLLLCFFVTHSPHPREGNSVFCYLRICSLLG